MKRIGVIILSMILIANPVFAKNHKKVSIECVPSPNPDVPPCDLDQTPLMPSEIAKKQASEKKSKNDTTNRTNRKAPRQRNNETGY